MRGSILFSEKKKKEKEENRISDHATYGGYSTAYDGTLLAGQRGSSYEGWMDHKRQHPTGLQTGSEGWGVNHNVAE